MDAIGILEDKQEQFIQDVCRKLQEKGYAAEYLELKHSEVSEIKNKYKVIIDRLSYEDDFLRTMMKVFSLQGCYVLNNPFICTSDDKVVEYAICDKLGIPYPKTIVLPKENSEVYQEVKIPQIDASQIPLKFPVVLKPHTGYGWKDVFFVNNIDELRSVYVEHNRKEVLIAQEYIAHKTYYRVYYFSNLDPIFVRYIPRERRYVAGDYADIKVVYDKIKEYTIKLNLALGYDFNALEWAIDDNDKLYLIDAMNEVPDILTREIPAEQYAKLVDNMVALVEAKCKANAKNKWPFEYSI
jgi:glutathione synthase/RimK-type ligase-like ATP-grasp enzyme